MLDSPTFWPWIPEHLCTKPGADGWILSTKIMIANEILLDIFLLDVSGLI